MTSDNERYEDIPHELDERVADADEGTNSAVPDGEPVPDFPQRWDEEPDDTAVAAADFGERWSKEPDDNSAEKAEEFGERWAAGLDDSSDRAEEFGATWSGDTQTGVDS
jgi:hypothetical protein